MMPNGDVARRPEKDIHPPSRRRSPRFLLVLCLVGPWWSSSTPCAGGGGVCIVAATQALYVPYETAPSYTWGQSVPIVYDKLASVTTLESWDYPVLPFGASVVDDANPPARTSSSSLSSTTEVEDHEATTMSSDGITQLDWSGTKDDDDVTLTRVPARSAWHAAMRALYGQQPYHYVPSTHESIHRSPVVNTLTLVAPRSHLRLSLGEPVYCQPVMAAARDGTHAIATSSSSSSAVAPAPGSHARLDAVRRDLRYFIHVDGIPVMVRAEDDTRIFTRHWGGIPVGSQGSIVTNDDDNNNINTTVSTLARMTPSLVYNHWNFELFVVRNGLDEATGHERYQIVRVIVQPFSIQHQYRVVSNSAASSSSSSSSSSSNTETSVPRYLVRMDTPLPSCQGATVLMEDNAPSQRIHTNYDDVMSFTQRQFMEENGASNVDSGLLFTYDVTWSVVTANDATFDPQHRWYSFLTTDALSTSTAGDNSQLLIWVGIVLGLVINLLLVGALYTWVRRDYSYKPLATMGWLLDHEEDEDQQDRTASFVNNSITNLSTSSEADRTGTDTNVNTSMVYFHDPAEDGKECEFDDAIHTSNDRDDREMSSVMYDDVEVANISDNEVDHVVSNSFTRRPAIVNETEHPAFRLPNGNDGVMQPRQSSRARRPRPTKHELTEAQALVRDEAILWPLSRSIFVPPHSVAARDLLVVFTGTGAQLLMTALVYLFLMQCGVLNQSMEADSVTAGLVLQTVFGIVGGYVSGRLASIWHEALNRTVCITTLGTATLFPIGTFFVVFLVYDVLPTAGTLSTPQYDVASKIVPVFLLWLFVAVPLTSLGGYLGHRQGAMPNFPVAQGHSYEDLALHSSENASSTIARKEPQRPWCVCSTRTIILLLVGGILPLICGFIEFSFAVAGPVYQDLYTEYHFILSSFLLFTICSILVSMNLFYRAIRLRQYGDGAWWWATWTTGASSGFYIFALSISWLIYYSANGSVAGSNFLAFLLWFLWASFAVALITGFTGVLAVMLFTRTLYFQAVLYMHEENTR